MDGLHRQDDSKGKTQQRDGRSQAARDGLTYAVIGCAQRVHAQLGPGFPETVYKRALCVELVKQQVPFVSEKEFEVCYDGANCGTFRVDLFVDDRLVVELKAADAICDQHKAQTLAYLKASGTKVGLLINFGQPSLKVKRFVN
ncbi:MAG: GxxExxY protein [Planctomycetota bacterium]